mgnify:CR=1 FL=1
MISTTKRLVVLGSTGSIGTQTLDIVRKFPDNFRVVGLAARNSLKLLGQQVKEFQPKFVHCHGSDEEKDALLPDGYPNCSMEKMVSDSEVDMVVIATSGDVALVPILSAIESGKSIALANKEAVIMAGELVTSRVRKHGVSLFPLDSEPNAIWQCLNGEEGQISKLIITASGGAFRDTPISELAHMTPRQALDHPTWKMGSKITIDSATMMNKAFEVIEAHWLFGVPWDDIDVVIHPQSVIHSMVDFIDGSVKAQISPPDMHLPIQYALFYPDRAYNDNIGKFNPVETGALTFEPWDDERYPCFRLALDFAKRGGTWPAALCGADEVAVEMFLSGRLGFLEIGPVIQEALKDHQSIGKPSLTDIMAAADWAKRSARRVLEGT